MTIINELESTGESDIHAIEGDLSAGDTILTKIDDGVQEIESTAEVIIAEPAHIIAEAHSFFDLAKAKIEHVIDEVLTHAKSTEEAIEAVILTAFGHATNEVHSIVDEVTSS
jgi:hypothetical protein